MVEGVLDLVIDNKHMDQNLLKYYDIDLHECTSLTLISSESCNLNCSYCVMANNINESNKFKETENIKKSFKDGSYLNTIKNIATRYNLNPLKINYIDLWGQEPTLTLNEFADSFKDFYEYFPNIKTLFFSTNGIAFPERIINLAKVLDNIVNSSFIFNFQISYDGEYATKILRGASPDIIKRNVETIILELNKIEFKNLTVQLSLHNVISSTLINRYGGTNLYDNEFKNYLQEFYELDNYYSNLNNNPNVIYNKIYPGIENPYNASVQEGKNLTQFIIKANEYGQTIEYKWWNNLLRRFLISEHDHHFNSLNLYANLLNFSSDKEKTPPIGCGFGYHNLKIRYDGTFIHCQNALTALYPKCNNEKTLGDLVREDIKKKNYFPNFFNDNDLLDIQKYLLRGKVYRISSMPFIVSEIINSMIILAKYNQINEDYITDFHKLFHHALLIAQSLNCWDNNLMTTGSGFGKLLGEIRLYCNGFLDLAVDLNEKEENYEL